jgi:hypothetical protein
MNNEIYILITTATGCELDDRWIGVRFSAEARDFSLHCIVQTGSGDHPVSYRTGTGGRFPREEIDRDMLMTTYLHLVLSLTIRGSIHSFPLITVAARSKAWTVFLRSNAAIVGSNPTRGMDVCVRLFCVCVVLRVRTGLGTGWSPFQGVLPIMFRIRKLEKAVSAQQRAVDP